MGLTSSEQRKNYTELYATTAKTSREHSSAKRSSGITTHQEPAIGVEYGKGRFDPYDLS